MPQRKNPTQRYQHTKKYNKYHLIVRNKKGKEIVANFGLRKYREGKNVGKSFYLEYNPDGLFYTPAFFE